MPPVLRYARITVRGELRPPASELLPSGLNWFDGAKRDFVGNWRDMNLDAQSGVRGQRVCRPPLFAERGQGARCCFIQATRLHPHAVQHNAFSLLFRLALKAQKSELRRDQGELARQ
jgi:hypothetical protein